MKKLGLAALAALAAGWLFAAAPPATPPRRPDVLLITIDTLRADATGFSGNKKAATPVLDRLAAQGRVFTDAHAHNVVTLPSHTNILTGLYPYQHGLRDNTGFRLAERFPTVATVLREAGYATGAFVGAYPLDSRFGLDRGFDVYDDRTTRGDQAETFSLAERRGDEVVAPALAWWTRQRGRPRFLWVHLYDPHAPYDPPEPFASRFAANPYLGEVAAVDSDLAPLLGPLLDRKEPPCLVVVTADHGESLGEHGEATHGLFAYEATLKIPLVVWGPGVAAGKDGRAARHVDIFPTVLAAAGVKPPAASPAQPGRSLLAASAPAEDSYFEALSTTLNRGWAPLRGLLRGGRKFIALPLPEAYELASDPQEARNRIDQDRTLARAAFSALPRESVWPPPRISGGGAEEEARLRSLGYLASSAPAQASYGPDDDPKRLVGLDRKIHLIIDRYSRGQVEESVRLAREAVQERPSMPLGHSLLAQGLLEAGRTGEAVEVMRRARAQGHASDALLRQLGLTLAEGGQSTEAIEVLRPLAETDDTDALNALALALSEAGRQREAWELLQRVLKIDPDNARACEQFGLVELRLGHWPQARDWSRRAVDRQRQLPRAWNNLGVALWQLGEKEKALDAWQQAVDFDPRLWDALWNLGLKAAELGRPAQARKALERFAAGAPPRYGEDVAKAREMLRRMGVRVRPLAPARPSPPAPLPQAGEGCRLVSPRHPELARANPHPSPARGRGAGGEGLLRAALFTVLCASAAACSPSADRSSTLPTHTPVILISIDTLRADHLPAFGYTGVETPHLDALRRDAVLFTNAYTPTPLTFPAHSSLLTGLLPGQHGVRDNIGYRLDEGKITRGELPFLPQILKGKGYATGGAVSAYVLLGRNGLSTGFDFYEDGIELRSNRGLGGLQRPGSETLRLSLDWLRGTAEKPFFFFFHIYEPHTPYAPPEPFAARYAASPYDGEIAAADAIVGELIAELKRLDVYDRALVILLSDHGEGLNEHGEEEHGVLLYREAIHVPLMVKLPEGRRAGETAEAPAELTDVVPTVLSLLGLPVPETISGRSLLTGEPGPERRAYSETFYPRLHFGWSELSSLIDRRWHYIEGPDPELYDLAADPRETRNLLRGEVQERRVLAERRRELAGYDRKLAPPAAVDEETRQAMIALGYVGGSGGATEGPLPDPKSRIGALADLKVGFRHSSRGEHREAAAAFRRVLAANPKMVDAWEFLARSLQKTGDTDAALEAYREALRISGGSPHIAMSAASLWLELGDLDEAETHAKLAEVAHPSFAHGLLARIALVRKDTAAAEREARLAMKDEGERVGPLITLAEVLHAKKDYPGALEATRQAAAAYERREAKDPDLIRGLALIRGRILADTGDAAGAEAAFREEIRLFPDSLRAYSSLALLYALSGRPAEVGPTLRDMVEKNSGPAAYAEAVKTLRAVGDPRSAAGLLRQALAQYPESRELRKLG